MKNALIIILLLLTAPAVLAGTAQERCVAALDEATRTLERLGPDELTKAESAEVKAAEKRAFGVCTSPAVPAELRNRAIVRWSGSLDAAAAKVLLEKALRETELSEGTDSAALLPLLDGLASVDSNVPAGRLQSLQTAERALTIRKQLFGEKSVEVARSLVTLGAFWAMEEMPDRDVVVAEAYLRQAVTIAEQAGPKSDLLQGALAMLYELVKAQPGREAEARQIQHRIEELHS